MTTDVKLTLKLKSDSILRAKEYVSQKGISLSKLVEDFFDNITFNSPEFSQTSYSPLVKELSGIISLSNDYDHKSEYEEYLKAKYE